MSTGIGPPMLRNFWAYEIERSGALENRTPFRAIGRGQFTKTGSMGWSILERATFQSAFANHSTSDILFILGRGGAGFFHMQ